MHAALQPAGTTYGRHGSTRDQDVWILTEDPGVVAEAKEVLYDVADLEDLIIQLEVRHPALEGFTFLHKERDSVAIRGSVQEKEGSNSDETIFQAAREYGTVELHYSSKFVSKHQDTKLVVLGDFVLSGYQLTFDPKKAAKVRRMQGNKGNKDITGGNPSQDLLKALGDSLWKIAVSHPVLSGLQMGLAHKDFSATKADMCRHVLFCARMIHTFNRGRDDWRESYFATESFWNAETKNWDTNPRNLTKKIKEAIEELIPYIEGLKARGKKGGYQKADTTEGVHGRNIWFYRLAIFLEHEQREWLKEA